MAENTLNALPVNQSAAIISIKADGKVKRRLLDMGFALGKTVTPLFKSPLGDPTAYRIMGSTVALRKDIASQIIIEYPAEVDFL